MPFKNHLFRFDSLRPASNLFSDAMAAESSIARQKQAVCRHPLFILEGAAVLRKFFQLARDRRHAIYSPEFSAKLTSRFACCPTFWGENWSRYGSASQVAFVPEGIIESRDSKIPYPCHLRSVEFKLRSSTIIFQGAQELFDRGRSPGSRFKIRPINCFSPGSSPSMSL